MVSYLEGIADSKRMLSPIHMLLSYHEPWRLPFIHRSMEYRTSRPLCLVIPFSWLPPSALSSLYGSINKAGGYRYGKAGRRVGLFTNFIINVHVCAFVDATWTHSKSNTHTAYVSPQETKMQTN
jgi:hypothetical protein